MRKPPFFALYTETTERAADLLVIFANRDEQTQQDVDGTKNTLEAAGEGVHVREFNEIAGVPVVLNLADAFPEAQSAAIHECLRILAGMCDGARQLDGAGFNKLDADFGRSLAQAPKLSQKQAACGVKLVRKYHRQLPADLLAAATISPAPQHESASDVERAGARCPAEMINHKYTKRIGDNYVPKSGEEVNRNGCEEPYGDTYQNGVPPGRKKLEQFREVLELMGTPKLYEQEGKGEDAIVYVKLFDPCGSWTWFITEFSETAPDGAPDLAFGLVHGHEDELGYVDVSELSTLRGASGIGIEIDMHFTPRPLKQVKEELEARAN